MPSCFRQYLQCICEHKIMRQVTLCSVLIVYCLCAAISSNQFDTSLFVCTNAVLEIYTQYNYASGYRSNNFV